MKAERMGAEAWARVRAIRLRALTDAPDAFATTLADEQTRPPEAWRARLGAPAAATFLVRHGSEDVGLVVGAEGRREGVAGLFAMWVAPEARGAGVGDALVRAVLDWARERGHPRIALEVADDNHPAIALYVRHGFRATGRRSTLPAPRTHIGEHELERPV